MQEAVAALEGAAQQISIALAKRGQGTGVEQSKAGQD
jgi:hypothetical protein